MRLRTVDLGDLVEVVLGTPRDIPLHATVLLSRHSRRPPWQGCGWRPPCRLLPAGSAGAGRLDTCTRYIVVGEDASHWTREITERAEIAPASRARPDRATAVLEISALVVEGERSLDAFADVQRLVHVPPGRDHHRAAFDRAEHGLVVVAAAADAVDGGRRRIEEGIVRHLGPDRREGGDQCRSPSSCRGTGRAG